MPEILTVAKSGSSAVGCWPANVGVILFFVIVVHDRNKLSGGNRSLLLAPLLLLQILENDWIEINRSSFHYLGKWIDIWAFYLFLSWQQLLKNGIIRLKSTKSFGHVYVKLQFLLLLWKCRWIWKWFWWFEVIFGSSLNPKIAFPTNNGKFTSAAAVTSKSDRHLRVPSVTWTRADGFAQTIFGLNRVMISLLVKNGLP